MIFATPARSLGNAQSCATKLAEMKPRAIICLHTGLGARKLYLEARLGHIIKGIFSHNSFVEFSPVKVTLKSLKNLIIDK